jgi:hypothetical protein
MSVLSDEPPAAVQEGLVLEVDDRTYFTEGKKCAKDALGKN